MRLLAPPAPPAPHDAGPAGRRGLLGERRVIAALAALDDRYLAIHRLRLPGTAADLDLVVIAARLIVLEVKTFRGPCRYRCQGAHWSYADSAGAWRPLGGSPGTQAAFGALRARRRLRDAGLPMPVEAAVVWAGDAPLDLAAPSRPVLRLAALPAWLAAIPPAAPQQAERLARLLLAGTAGA